MANPQKHALTVLADPALSTSGGQLEALQRSVIEQLKLIKRMEGEAALRGVIAGLAFHRVKLSIPGGFRKWIDSEEGLGKSQVNNLMRLASVFLEKSRANRVELLAMSGESGELLDSGDEAVRRFMSKAQSFVGECSLNELLVKYGIKGVTREEDGENAAAAAPGDEGQMWFSEIAQHLFSFRQSVLKPESIVRLPPDKLREILREHNAQNIELKELCAKAGIE